MKRRNKVKKKLNRKEFFNEHGGTIIAISVVTLTLANTIIFPFAPAVAIGLLCTAGVVGGIFGGLYLTRDKAREEEIENAKEDLDAVTSPTRSDFFELNKQIEDAKTNKEKQALIKRKKLLEENLQENDQGNEMEM